MVGHQNGVATLIGIMMHNGTVAANTTLETALPSVDWNAVASAEEKKTITLAQVLSMSSGLQAPCLSYGAQDTVEAVLNSPTFADGDVGSFNYLCSGSILSYVIFQQTGKTPLAYAREVLFPTLGINDDVVWTPTHGSDGIHESGHGMVLGPMDLAARSVISAGRRHRRFLERAAHFRRFRECEGHQSSDQSHVE